MINKSVFITMFSLFFFNATTECMLQRVSLIISRRSIHKTAPIATQQDTAPLSNEERNEFITQAMKNAVKEELAQREVEDTTKKTIKYSRNIPSWNVAK